MFKILSFSCTHPSPNPTSFFFSLYLVSYFLFPIPFQNLFLSHLLSFLIFLFFSISFFFFFFSFYSASFPHFVSIFASFFLPQFLFFNFIFSLSLLQYFVKDEYALQKHSKYQKALRTIEANNRLFLEIDTISRVRRRKGGRFGELMLLMGRREGKGRK